jgi:hypothetical protein
MLRCSSGMYGSGERFIRVSLWWAKCQMTGK